ncbi:ankyrin repeat domain-containing protein [Myxococcota bacterium]|nr:ankyrin repeat domain-containing protein [Myxococcota bacterium]
MSTLNAALSDALRADDPAALAPLLTDPGLAALAPVAQAASAGALMCLERLLGAGFDVNARRLDELTALHLSTDLKVTRRLLAAGASVSAVAYGETPLHLAAANAGPPVIKALLAAGADANALNRHETTPLGAACALQRVAAVEALLTQAPAPETTARILAELSQRGQQKKDLAVLKAFLKVLPADHGPVPGFGFPLHLAAKAGAVEAVDALVAAGAVVDRPDPQGRTALWLAVNAAMTGFDKRPRHQAVVLALLAAGADPNHPSGGQSPRALAAARGRTI